MKKFFLCAGMLLSTTVLHAQVIASLGETALPATAGWGVVRPQNAGSSTLQEVNFLGSLNNLYVHSWDVFSGSFLPNAGIAWRRSDAVGSTMNDGQLTIDYANDLDVVLFEYSGSYYVLAAYYYDDGTTTGHYYDLYNFTATGLSPATTMNLLGSSPTFGRINVDATVNGLAITWEEPGTGIYVKAASISGTLTIGPSVLLPGTSNYKDADVCVSRYSGNHVLEITYRSNAEDEVVVQRLDFADALSGSTASLATEYNNFVSFGRFGVPRIDCPDNYPDQKWTAVYAEYTASGTTVGERIYAAVQNSGFSPTPTTVLVHSASFTSGFYHANNPVIAYNDNSSRIYVGWLTADNTIVLPGTSTIKYVADIISDNTFSGPVLSSGTYMMISNTDGGPAPVLAFSGQNDQSNFDGLHTAYSQYNTSFPGNYSMLYKDKPWGSAFFKMATGATTAITPSVFPNPFVNKISLQLPVKAHYDIRITGIDGRTVYTQDGDFEAQQISINTASFGSGIYLVQISAPEQNILFTQKLVK